jgi:hypothetical protein
MTDCPSCRGAGVDADGNSCPACTGIPTADLLDFSQAREAALRRDLESTRRERDALVAQAEEMLAVLRLIRQDLGARPVGDVLAELDAWLARFRR